MKTTTQRRSKTTLKTHTTRTAQTTTNESPRSMLFVISGHVQSPLFTHKELPCIRTHSLRWLALILIYIYIQHTLATRTETDTTETHRVCTLLLMRVLCGVLVLWRMFRALFPVTEKATQPKRPEREAHHSISHVRCAAGSSSTAEIALPPRFQRSRHVGFFFGPLVCIIPTGGTVNTWMSALCL